MNEIDHKKKIYYSMGEVAEMFDVNQSLLRFWEKQFDIIKPHRNKKGNRLFTREDVENIRLVYHLLKERKMKIEVARQYLKTGRSEVERDAEIMERLLSIRSMLQEIKRDMHYDGDVIDDAMEDETVISSSGTGAISGFPDERTATDKDRKGGMSEVKPESSADVASFELSVSSESQTAGPVTQPRFVEQMLFATEESGERRTETPVVGNEAPPAEETKRPRIIEQTLF